MSLPTLPRYAMVVDIETLDTRPSARVLSVGYALVDTQALAITSWSQFYLDQNEQLGRTTSEETTKWWTGQPEAWRRQCGVERGSAREMFADMRLTAKPDCPEPDARTTWWGYGPSFDLVVLESLAADCGLTVPWTYRDHRDLRTLFELADVHPSQFRRDSELEHDAEADALAEARTLIAALKKLGYEAAQPAVEVGA